MTNKQKVMELFYKFIDSDVREDLMESLNQVDNSSPELVDDISEEQATTIVKMIEEYAAEGLTIQGESGILILGFLKIIEEHIINKGEKK